MSDDALGRPRANAADFRAASLPLAVLDFAVAAALACGRFALTRPDVRVAAFATEVACAGVALFLGLIVLRARAEVGRKFQRRYAVNASLGSLAAFGACVMIFGVSLYFADARNAGTFGALALTAILCVANHRVCRKVIR